MFNKLRYLLIGSPIPTQNLSETKLNKVRALAAFSPDALSSIAYANQEIYLGLVVAGSAGLSLILPVGLVISGVLVFVALSYFQTIQGYPSGGGSYIVARDNLGVSLGLVAAAALLVDYLLTAAVSLTAAVGEIASAFPVLWPHRILLALLILALITIANLRGMRETGTLMAIPVYSFLIIYFVMLAYGLVRAWIDGPGNLVSAAPAATEPLKLFLVLKTFSSGCTALTGIESISNGVPAFRSPESKNAGKTLLVMAILMATLFIGSLGLTHYLAIVAGAQETILSALSRRIFGSGIFYVLVQFSTMLILAVAANTSFADFPRVVAILAGDGFLPRQLTNLGDRLVYANGIVLLAVGTGVLIVTFGGNSHALIPLFAIGAFLAFTLSQSGMVIHWFRQRGKSWRIKAFFNGIGALATGITVIVIATSKFLAGAWITAILIPALISIFWKIHSHYEEVGKQLSLRGLPPSMKPFPTHRVVVPISGIHRGMFDAVNFARSISEDVTAVFIELKPGSGEQMSQQWQKWWPDVPLVIVPSPFRSIIGTLLDFLDETDRLHNDGQMATVIMSEIVPYKWWQELLHNQTSFLLRAALIYRHRQLGFQRVIIDVPYHLRPISRNK
jgi:amino acid transporter